MLTTVKCELKSFEDLAHNFAAKELAANRKQTTVILSVPSLIP